MIRFNQKGDFTKLNDYLVKIKKPININTLHKYGADGVSALSLATPIDTGRLANSWYYEIKTTNTKTTITFCNSDIENDVPVAIILQYGHATKNGGFVEGIDYINPALKSIFERLANSAWEEVTKT